MELSSVSTSRMKRWTMLGASGGLAGAVAMAMYAMVVSAAYKDVGFFTPLYHIASAFISPQAMMASMEQAAAGDTFTFDAWPALVGMLAHLVTGAVAGAVYGALASLLTLSRALVVAAGALYGLAVMVSNAFVGLPIVAAVFGGGDPISDMPSMVGWGTFTIEHLLYGLVLGAVVAIGTGRRAGTSGARHRVTATA
jgi:hypothetical protein